jgi:hypothetical protein
LLVTSAGAAAPAGQSAAPASAPEEAWSLPTNVSTNSDYDNTPWIGIAPNGGATIAWERRDEVAGTYGAIVQASNAGLGGPFLSDQQIQDGAARAIGSPKVANDSSGRRHIVWWELANSRTCGYYSRVDADAVVRVIEQVPGTCMDPAEGRKNTAVAVGPDGVVHALFGKDQQNMFYYRLEPSGVWSVQGERITGAVVPKNIAIGVNNQNTIMATWIDRGPKHNDVLTSIRQPAGGWGAPQNISALVCQNDTRSSAHLPAIADAPNGGLRVAWSQIRCDPYTDPGYDEVYYREWVPGTGWASQPILRLTGNSGNSYNPAITVDSAGQSHIMWSDDTNRNRGNFQLYYAKGTRAGFTPPVAAFEAQFGGAFQKEASLDTNYGTAPAVHVAFGSNRDDAQKENYYSYARTGGCVMTFTDVRPTDYFYEPVRYLFCAGAISGYSDNTFRPFSNSTRAQITKIVVLGFGFPLVNPPAPTFVDVPPTDPFYTFIETAVSRGLISGYADRTFRPNLNITRAQLSKIVVVADGGALYTPPEPTFDDVPDNHPFYVYIETAYRKGLITGYSNWTFRPSADATRGQISKIVYTAVTR